MKRVLFRAPALSISGYGTHARQIFRWLETKNVDLTVDLLSWGITSWHVNPSSENGLIGRIMSKVSPPNGTYDVVISLQLPNEWKHYPEAFNVGMTALVETDKCSQQWVSKCNEMDRIIVPTTFTESVLRNSGNVNTDVRVVHESFPDEVFTVDEGLSLEEVTTQTNFLVVGQLTGMKPDVDRKNIFYTVKWFCEAFKGRKDVSLIVKSNLGTNTTVHKSHLETIFKNLLKEVRQGEFPKVHLVNGEMTTSEIVSLYKSKKISALLSLTKGEGFGLPILEAAACNVPVICTNWSGHLDFMKLGKYIGIDYDLKDLPKERIDKNIFIEGAKWAQPVEEDFKKKALKFANSQHLPKKWASELGETLREKFSFQAVCSQYEKQLGDLF